MDEVIRGHQENSSLLVPQPVVRVRDAALLFLLLHRPRRRSLEIGIEENRTECCERLSGGGRSSATDEKGNREGRDTIIFRCGVKLKFGDRVKCAQCSAVQCSRWSLPITVS